MGPKFGRQTLQIAPTAVKPFLRQVFGPQIAIFHVSVQMFGKNLMLKVHGILLCNHSRVVHS